MSDLKHSDLLTYIFDGKKPAFYGEFDGWVKSSRRFKAFAITYRGKIRTKLKHVSDEAGMKDLRAELEAAALLLREPKFTLEYEKYAASRKRGPDFTVTFKTHTPFNVEVRRIRSGETDDNAEARVGKLMAVLCDKVGQTQSGIVNLLWMTAERGVSEADLTDATTTLRLLAERKAEDFFTKRGFESAVAFLKQYQQLSGIVLWQERESVFWLNSLARHKAPQEIVTALQKLVHS